VGAFCRKRSAAGLSRTPAPARGQPRQGREDAGQVSRRARFAPVVALLLLIGALASAPVPLLAQDFGRVVSPILTLDRDRLFNGTLYGQRVNRELESASTAMAAETREIETALEAEEQALTEQRATMAPEAFRSLATAFDEKVQALRAERKAAEADLLSQIDAAQADFFNRIGPVLGQLVRERGAVLIVDRRAVLLAATDVDITPAAIERIDAVLGDGGDLGANGATDTQASPAVPDAAEVTGEGAVGVDTIPAPITPAQGDPAASEN